MRSLHGASVGLVVLAVTVQTAPPASSVTEIPVAELMGRWFARDFVVSCGFSHRASDDPIVHPGRPGAAHQHDFWGSTSTNAFSTVETLQATPTTCNRLSDTAAYWMPSVLQAGVPLQPGRATFYYRGTGDTAESVLPMPPGFKMIAGDHEATSPQPLTAVEWACREEGAKKPWRAEIPTCPAGTDLAFRVNFPDCWNGVDLDSADHRSHVAYSSLAGDCPSTHPIRIPELAMTVTYPNVGEGPLSLSSGSPFSGHADFMNGWRPGALEALVEGCLHRARQCGHFAGPGGAGPIVPVRPATTTTGHRDIRPVSPGGRGLRRFSQSPAISVDGRRVAYERFLEGHTRVVVQDLAAGTEEEVDVTALGAAPDGNSYDPSLNGDGTVVTFRSAATNLVANDTNGVDDVFIRDLESGTIERVSPGRGQANHHSSSPVLSADGRYVAFTSFASNLVAGDVNSRPDVFRFDRVTKAVSLASVGLGGYAADDASAAPAISADGNLVAFESRARNLVPSDTNEWSDVFIRDMAGGGTTLVSITETGRAANNSSYAPSMSADGAVVAFESAATNLVAGDKGARDVFVRDRSAGTTTRISGLQGKSLDGASEAAAVSADGRFVVFQSANNYLSRADGNGTQDVVLFDRQSRAWELVSTTPTGVTADGASSFPALSRDGRTVVFESTAGNLMSEGGRARLGVYAASR